jgi:hypothetical protein
MMGWKSDDYEPDVSWNSVVAGSMLMIGVGLAVAWASTQRDCWTLGRDEIETRIVEGRAKATLDLRRIPKGECVQINTSKP